MTKHDIKLILTDIDGTILPYGQPCVSERTIAAFHAAQAAGIHIGPASGRGFSHIPASFAGDVACCTTCLANNGMQVYLDGAVVHEARIPRKVVVRLAELTATIARAGVVFFEKGVPMLLEGDVADLRQSFPTYAAEAVRVNEVPPHDIEKVNVFIAGGMAYTQEVMDIIAPKVREVDVNIPMAGFLNFTPVGWSKASGIDVLCEALGIGLDQVVVFGDGGNDVEMLAHAPLSVAVEGADPRAVAAAHLHVGRCEDESVQAAIEAIAAGEWPFA